MKSIKSIKELLSIVDSIEGWLTAYEQLALLHLPPSVDHLSGDIVEIGSFKGKSTIALALGSSFISSKKRPIYAIDPFVVPPFQYFWIMLSSMGLNMPLFP